MAPLVLHNVPDDELYTGKDGVTRPFAIVGAADERRSARLRRQAATNHGSFGRARSRQQAGSVGPSSGRTRQTGAKVTATTVMAADVVFSTWKKEQETLYEEQHQPGQTGESVGGGRTMSSGSLGTLAVEDATGPSATAQQQQQQQAQPAQQPQQTQQSSLKQKPPNQPTEIVLRGYRSPDYQYAALHRYEQIAGRICEDYPRDPPVASRRGTGDHEGTALTAAEREAVMQRAASGQHWVKVTFESAQAADAALYASPQSVLGYLVTAEPYRGASPPAEQDVAVPDPSALMEYELARHGLDGAGGSFSSYTVDSGTVTREGGRSRGGAVGSPSSSTTFSGRRNGSEGSSPGTGAAAANKVDASGAQAVPNSEFCRRIPTARRATLKSPEQALLPRESATRRFVKRLPLLHRLTGTIIGNQVPRKENGLFDWDKANLYWKLIWWLDFLFALFAGEILDANKDD
ncbi:hypothetical protein SPI_09336 [Niveomyces insectorum RCEF 264]|uniref:Nup53p-like protein n=1 Tax=Niveomyces insectorum RCEF 264 TaxID=1081102 RepID=A0A167LX82_9HYPO|nr:hypothetical protein SPI_09336 [Niveomyces insectorum RCEF 264]